MKEWPNMFKGGEYPLNFNFWDESQHYSAIDDLSWNQEEVTVIGNEEVIVNFHGYDIPDGFLIIKHQDGSISTIHQSRLNGGA